MIVAGWFANIFDAMCFLLVAAGLLLLAKRHAMAAGFVLGLAWFCKESAVFVLPVLAYLAMTDASRKREWLVVTAIYLVLALVYFYCRHAAVVLGSANDIHTLSLAGIAPTFLAFLTRLWVSGPTGVPAWGGLLLTLAVLVSSRSWRVACLCLLLGGVAALAYMGMIEPGLLGLEQPLISPAVFTPRLFLIPTGLLLFALLHTNSRLALLLALIGGACSVPYQYLRQRSIQESYAALYRQGEAAPGGLMIHATQAMGVQGAPLYRGVMIGDFPHAHYSLNPDTGRLEVRNR